GGGTALWGPHLLALALSALALVALYRLLREAFPAPHALLGCAVLAINPLFIHYAPFVMTDIPAMLFLTAAAVAYLRARRLGGWHRLVLAAVALGAAMATKYNSALMLGSLGLFEALRVIFPARSPDTSVPGFSRRAVDLLVDARPWLVVAGSVLVLLLVQAAADARAVWGGNAFAHVIDNVRFYQRGLNGAFASDPIFEYVLEFGTVFSLPLVLLALAGMLLAAFRHTEVDLLCLAWFWVVFATITFLIGHKEARYTFSTFPPLIYFMVAALRTLSVALVPLLRRLVGEGSASRRVPGLVASLLLLCFAPKPVALGASELRHFYDPVYTKPFLPEVARWALAHSAPGQRVLVRRYFTYSMYPANPLLMTYDEFFHFHHIGPCALAYFLDRPVEPTEERDPIPPPAEDGRLGSARLVERFATSEVVVTGGRLIDTEAGAWSEPPEPLILTFVGRRTLRLEEATADGASYRAADGQGQRLVVVRDGDGWELTEGDPGPDWQVYQRGSSDGPVEPFGPRPASGPPAVIELVRVEQVQRTFR
ncbi:MAG TPA: glycosyltransferase family 39 protein, partial [Verrucomicrobiae bacterium]|nr:glycosyltransferase family 39 protein [Verrucomicrobiae bacterium]